MKKYIKKQNVAVALNSGRVGNVRYYTKDGNTYTRTVSSSVNNPRSEGQMRQRTKVSNLVNNYRMLKNFLGKCFQNANSCVSIYNLFFQKGMVCTPVYLTKEMAGSGAAVAAPYGISDGSLPRISYGLNSNGILQTNLSLGDLNIGAATTVGELAQALVENNEGVFRYGDFISFIEVIQKGSETLPLITAKGDNIQLAKNSPELLADKISTHGFATVGGCLGMDDEPEAGCYAWIHSRRNSGVKVSGQYLYNCNEEMLSHFTSDEAFQAASASYGESAQNPFITSDDGEGGDEPVPPVEGKTVKLSIPSAMQSMGDIQINDRTKAKTDTLVVPTGTSVVIKAIPVSGDYQFNSWSDGITTSTRTLTVSEDIDLTASFSPVE